MSLYKNEEMNQNSYDDVKYFKFTDKHYEFNV